MARRRIADEKMTGEVKYDVDMLLLFTNTMRRLQLQKVHIQKLNKAPIPRFYSEEKIYIRYS